MKILIVGGKGTIGKKIVSHYSEIQEVIVAGRSNGVVEVDITSAASIQNMFDKVGKVDAIICAAGAVINGLLFQI